MKTMSLPKIELKKHLQVDGKRDADEKVVRKWLNIKYKEHVHLNPKIVIF